MIKSFILHPRVKSRRNQVARAIIDYPFNHSNIYPLARDLVRDRAEAKFSMAAYTGCTERDVWDERDREKAQLVWNTPAKRHSRARESVNSPLFALRFTAFEMRLNSEKINRASLARVLGVSVATLYRRYCKWEVQKICTSDDAATPSEKEIEDLLSQMPRGFFSSRSRT